MLRLPCGDLSSKHRSYVLHKLHRRELLRQRGPISGDCMPGGIVLHGGVQRDGLPFRVVLGGVCFELL